MRELNLLPPDYRQALKWESILFAVRRIANGVLAGLLVLTVAGGLLATGFWFTAQSSPAGPALPAALKRYQALRSTITDHNRILEAITERSQERLVWGLVLPSFFAALPPDTVLERVEGNSVSRRLVVTGRASSRSALIVVEERLRNLPWVKQVISSPSNLLVRQNPPLQFQVEIQNILPSPTPVSTVLPTGVPTAVPTVLLPTALPTALTPR